MEESLFHTLPHELIADVFERLHLQDLLRSQAVNKFWHEKIWRTQSWLEITEKDFLSTGLHNILTKFDVKVFQELHMYEHELSDADVVQICRLTNINSLIYEQPFGAADDVPNVKLNALLSSLTRLQHLTLGLWSDHMLELHHLTRLTELTSLEIDITDRVTLEHFASLSHLTQLTHLTLYAPMFPSLDSTTFAAAAHWSRMRSLALIVPASIDLAPLKHFAQLVDLELDSTSVGDQHMAFEVWTNMTRLCLVHTRVTADTLTTLGTLTALRELVITKNGHVYQTAWITTLANLKKVNFGHTRISDQTIEHLAQVPNLEMLNLCGCRRLSPRAVKHLKSMTRLSCLNLSESGVLHGHQGAKVLDALSVDLLVANPMHGPGDLNWTWAEKDPL